MLKEVTFITGVVTGMMGSIVPPNAPQERRYWKGQYLHDQVFPSACETLPNGMVVDLTMKDIQSYISQSLAWLPLRNDEELVEKL